MGSNPTLSAMTLPIVDCQFPIDSPSDRPNQLAIGNWQSSIFGKVQEWLNWQHWKCCVRQRTVGSNPTLSAIFKILGSKLSNSRSAQVLNLMVKSKVFLTVIAFLLFLSAANAQRRTTGRLTVCGNPNAACPSAATFEPHDLPFRVPRNAVIWETELFYAVVLKSMNAPDENCDAHISETERVAAQVLFPDRKVFASRCVEPGTLYYTNTRPNTRLMAVYAGPTLTEANRILAAVKATGKFSGAYVRRMRAGFNGT